MSFFEILANATITYYAGRAIVEASGEIVEAVGTMHAEYVIGTCDSINEAIDSLNDTGLTTADDPADFIFWDTSSSSDDALLESLLT